LNKDEVSGQDFMELRPLVWCLCFGTPCTHRCAIVTRKYKYWSFDNSRQPTNEPVNSKKKTQI